MHSLCFSPKSFLSFSTLSPMTKTCLTLTHTKTILTINSTDHFVLLPFTKPNTKQERGRERESDQHPKTMSSKTTPTSNDHQWIECLPQTFMDSQSLNGFLESTPTARTSTAAVSKPIRRRSRASKKTPTTLLNANANNFRALVQQFTGCPNTPISFRNQRGPVNLNFGLKNATPLIEPLGKPYDYHDVQSQTVQPQQHQHQWSHFQETDQVLHDQQSMYSLNNVTSDVFQSLSINSNPSMQSTHGFGAANDVSLHDYAFSSTDDGYLML